MKTKECEWCAKPETSQWHLCDEHFAFRAGVMVIMQYMIDNLKTARETEGIEWSKLQIPGKTK